MTHKRLVWAGMVFVFFVILGFQVPWNASLERSLLVAIKHRGDVPRNERGYVSLEQILNERGLADVDPEQNIASDFMRVFGPSKFYRGAAERHLAMRQLKMLGVSELMPSPLKVLDSADAAPISHPWQSKDYPAAEQWLNDHQVHLDWMVAASFKEQYFLPYLTPQQSLLLGYSAEEMVQRQKSISNALAQRAMRSLGRGDARKCLADLASIRRLADRCSGYSQNEYRGTVECMKIAFQAELETLRTGNLSDEMCQAYQELLPLPDLDASLKVINQGERLLWLSCVQTLAYEPEAFGIEGLGDAARFTNLTDWGAAVDVVNLFFDRLVAANELPRQKRKIELERIEQEIMNLSPQFRVALAGARSRGFAAGEFLISLYGRSSALKFENLFLHKKAYATVARTGFALERYRLKNGQFPVTLSALVPEFLSAVPLDPLAGGPLNFAQIEKQECVVYSNGANGIDETLDERFVKIQSPETDDISWRIERTKSRD